MKSIHSAHVAPRKTNMAMESHLFFNRRNIFKRMVFQRHVGSCWFSGVYVSESSHLTLLDSQPWFKTLKSKGVTSKQITLRSYAMNIILFFYVLYFGQLCQSFSSRAMHKINRNGPATPHPLQTCHKHHLAHSASRPARGFLSDQV